MFRKLPEPRIRFLLNVLTSVGKPSPQYRSHRKLPQSRKLKIAFFCGDYVVGKTSRKTAATLTANSHSETSLDCSMTRVIRYGDLPHPNIKCSKPRIENYFPSFFCTMETNDVLNLYAAGVLDEEEVSICLMPMYETRFFTARGLNLKNLTADQCNQYFRFQPDHLPLLAETLKFPATIVFFPWRSWWILPKSSA